MASMKVVWFLLVICVTVFGRPDNAIADDSDENSSSEDDIPLKFELPKRKTWNDLIVCDKCPAGYGLVSMCNATQRTICQPCTLSITYSAKEPHFRPCMPCSKCGTDMYEDVACTTVSDTFCDSCSTIKGVRNDDYMKKCKTKDPNAIDKFDVDWGFPNDVDDDDDDDDDLDVEVDKFQLVDDNQERLFPRVETFKPSDADEEIVSILRETSKELTKVSKEQGELMENFEDDLKQIYDDTEEELMGDYKPVDFNVTEFEKSIDDSVKMIESTQPPQPLPVDVDDKDDDKSSAEDDADLPQPDWPWTRQNKPFVTDDDPSASEFSFNDRSKDEKINYKPSVHGYPYEELLHPEHRYAQVRKVLWLYGITAVLLVAACMFITCYAGSYYRRRRGYGFVAVQLTDHDSRIIRDCAQRLEQSEKVVGGEKRRNPFLRRQTSEEDDLHVHENPLESYLDDQTFNGSTESLIPTVHKGTQKANTDNIV